MERIGRGAGRGPGDVVELVEEYKRLAGAHSLFTPHRRPYLRRPPHLRRIDSFCLFSFFSITVSSFNRL